jgi:hypothetical protein
MKQGKFVALIGSIHGFFMFAALPIGGVQIAGQTKE